MSTLNYWNTTWSLDEAQCPCDLHLLDYLDAKGAKGASIFHFGTGNHHIVGLRTAQNGSDNAVLGITASPHEYQAYIELLIKNPRLGHSYKAYGALSDLGMALVLADKVKVGGEILFYTGSFAYDKAEEVAKALSQRSFRPAGTFKSLHIISKHAAAR
jgi:hypothetical protein